jgi:hypothetical protein
MNRFYTAKVLAAVPWISSVSALIPMQAGAQSTSATTNSPSKSQSELDQRQATIWQNDIGQGFRSGTQMFSVEAGISPGMATFGSRQAHDFALASFTYGRVLGPVIGEGHWYRGNVEARFQWWGGGQYSPSSEYVIGFTPHLRYDFTTGTRLVPFLDGGAGVTATSIGPPDMSGTFEFNLQVNGGAYWFLCDHLALTAEGGYMHMSCAGINHPNLGANNVSFMIGLTWFFGS